MTTSTIIKTSVLGLLVACASGAFANELNLQGYVTGHFGTGTSTTLDGLSYQGSTFNVNTAGGFYGLGGNAGTPNINNLGSFTLSGSPSVYNGQSFTLDVTFTAPTGISGSNQALYTAALQGQVNSNNAGGVYVQFDNSPRLFSFNNSQGNGSYTLSVNTLSLFPTQTTSVTGYGTGKLNAVPEPGSIAALGMGIGGLLIRRRRKSA